MKKSKLLYHSSFPFRAIIIGLIVLIPLDLYLYLENIPSEILLYITIGWVLINYFLLNFSGTIFLIYEDNIIVFFPIRVIFRKFKFNYDNIDLVTINNMNVGGLHATFNIKLKEKQFFKSMNFSYLTSIKEIQKIVDLLREKNIVVDIKFKSGKLR